MWQARGTASRGRAGIRPTRAIVQNLALGAASVILVLLVFELVVFRHILPAPHLPRLAFADGVIISEETYLAARDVLEVRRLGEVTVKGKTRPIVAYELRGIRDAAERVPAAVSLTKEPARAY